jgi:hypothetical protein
MLIVVACSLCAGSSERTNESAIPTVDINISIGGKLYNIHVDRNTTEEFDRIVALIDELLGVVNKG